MGSFLIIPRTYTQLCTRKTILKIYARKFVYLDYSYYICLVKSILKTMDKHLQIVSTFEPKLVAAFTKMIKGINIELSETGRKIVERRYAGFGRWCFIQAIESDETLTICNSRGYIFKGLNLSNIKL